MVCPANFYQEFFNHSLNSSYMKYIAMRENVEKYAQYIAERPGSHGLFGDDDTIDLQKAMDELKDDVIFAIPFRM